MFSAAFSAPTIQLVTWSETPRSTKRRGVMSLIQSAMGAATIPALTRTGLETAIVLGVISPNRSRRGTMMAMLMRPARASP